jgi:hypothetical protein
MKKINFYFLVFFTIALGLVSCRKEDTEISKTGLVPLKSGNTWIYKVYRSNVVVDTVILRVGDYVTINGTKGFKFSSGDNSFSETFLADNDDEGNFISLGGYSEKDTLFAISIRYKRNAIKGDSWDFQEVSYVNNSYFEKINIKMHCVCSDTTIHTSKGDFKCKAYQWSPDSGEDVFTDYVSENIGSVKTEHFENNHLFSSQVLLDYKIGE